MKFFKISGGLLAGFIVGVTLFAIAVMVVAHVWG